jgi:hypothetical protein
VNEQTVAVIGILCAFLLALSPVACTMNRHRLIAEAIKAGADPLEAKCAIESDGWSACATYASGRKR